MTKRLGIQLALLAALALIIRIIATAHRGFWFDEAYSYLIANNKDLFRALLLDNNPPIYYLIINVLAKFTTSEFFLRLPSLAAGLTTIFLTYFLTKKFYEEKIALLAALLVTVSPQTVYFSSEARPHAIAIFEVLALIYLFFNISKRKNVKPISVFIIAATVSILTQYYVALIFIPFSAFIYLKKIFSLKKWLIILALIFTLPALWFLESAKYNHSLCYCPPTLISLPQALASNAINGSGFITPSYFLQLPRTFLYIYSLTLLITIPTLFLSILKEKIFSRFYFYPLLAVSLLGLFYPAFSPKAFAIFNPLILIAISKVLIKNKALSIILPSLFAIISLHQIYDPLFRDNLKVTASKLSSANLPIFHASVFSYYPTIYYHKNPKNNYLIGKNPLSAELVEIIGGKEQINPNDTEIILVESKIWKSKTSEIYVKYKITSEADFGNLKILSLKLR